LLGLLSASLPEEMIWTPAPSFKSADWVEAACSS